MLSFELAFLILLIAIIILEILYIRMGPPAKPTAEEKKSVGEKTPPKKLTATAKSPKEGGKKQSSTQQHINPPTCPHGFEDLKKRDKHAPIPDECLSCPRIIECLSS